MDKVFYILSWILGIFILLMSFGAFTSSIAAGLLVLIASFIIIPITRNLIQDKTNRMNGLAERAISVIVLIFVAVIFFPTPDSQEHKNTPAPKIQLTAEQKAQEEKEKLESLSSELQKDKTSILANIAKQINDRKYSSALETLSKYSPLNDADIERLTNEAKKQEKISKQFSAWDGSHLRLTSMIKENMNDPDSYEHVKTLYAIRGDKIYIETTFRGKNAFGGKVLNKVTANADMNGNIIEILSQN